MFFVKEIVSADEIIVEPAWNHQGHTGNHVIVSGYDTPKEGMYGFEFAKKKLKTLIQEKEVQLLDPKFFPAIFGMGKVVCRVRLDGTDISNYFPEFKTRKPGFNDPHY